MRDFGSDEPQSACIHDGFRGSADDRPTASPESVRPDADELSDYRTEKACKMQAFPGAAEGIRTLDVLHGKQKPCVSWSACLFPANAGVLGCEKRPAIPRLLPGVHGLGTHWAPSSATGLVVVGRARGPARSLCVRSRRGLP